MARTFLPHLFFPPKEKLIGICSHKRSWPVGVFPLKSWVEVDHRCCVWGDVVCTRWGLKRPLKCVCQGEKRHILRLCSVFIMLILLGELTAPVPPWQIAPCLSRRFRNIFVNVGRCWSWTRNSLGRRVCMCVYMCVFACTHTFMYLLLHSSVMTAVFS